MFPFSLLLSIRRIMFPIVHGWMNRHNRPLETKVSPISHLGLQDNWMTRYSQTEENPIRYTRQSDALDIPVKMICSLKNSVVHFVRKPLFTVILAQERTRDDIALRCRIFQASCTFVATKLRLFPQKETCRMPCTGAAPPLFRPAK